MTVVPSTKSESPVVALLTYCAASIMMTVTNKLVLSSYQFKMTFLVLAIQNTCTVLMLVASARCKILTYRKLNLKDSKNWLPIAFALVMMMYTGAQTLRYMSIPLFTIFKNLTIILIAYGELYFFNGAAITNMILSSFGLLVASSVVAGWTDIASGHGLKSDDQGLTLLLAYFWMSLNCLTTAFFSLFLRAKIREVGFKDFDTVFYNNLLSIPILLVGSIVFERSAFVESYEKFVTNSDESGAGLLVALAFSSISAFAISYGTSMCIRLTSSTTYSMVGALNKLPISISGMLFFADPITFGSVSGVFIAFAGGVLYSFAKSEQLKETVRYQRVLPVHMAEKQHVTADEKIVRGGGLTACNSTDALISESKNDTDK
ncbi:GDP-mannose transporter into the lumen of the Golgi [Podochytrium sp. JEL0797]|nr:GDP-mannose transporter into the lumen of the Golgi [Podochytrium sp. JEL0797]